MENKAARQYLARIKRTLVCDRNDRRRLLARCAVMVDDFQLENPGAGYDGIVAAFGEPASFAAELLSRLETTKVEDTRKRRRSVCFGAFAVMITALIAISVFWYVKYVKTRDLTEHCIVVEFPAREFTDEELEEYLESHKMGN